MSNSPYIPPGTDLDTEIDFREKNRKSSSDKRLYAILFTISICVIIPFSWAVISSNRIQSECYFYALGAVHEYQSNGTLEEESLKVDAGERFENLPKEIKGDKEWMENTFKKRVAYEGKSKSAYEYCLKFNE